MPERPPSVDEYAPHQRRYIEAVEGPILETLRAQAAEVQRVLLPIDARDAGYRYAAGKWSIREVAGHLSDAERVYASRALAIAQGAITLPKYDPDANVAAADYEQRTIASLVEEFLNVRESTLQLFASLPAEAWSRRATLGAHPLSVRALAWIAAGHVVEHLDVLHTRYGVSR